MLTPGKIRALQTVSSADGIFKILAIDHRDSLRVVIDPNRPMAVPATQLTEIKLDVIRHVGPHATAVMLEPVYSAAQAIITHTLSGNVGFLCALEAQGYMGEPSARATTLLDNWSVEKAKRLGASGIKLLVYYHPDEAAASERQRQLIQGVIQECARYDIPLFLEPLFYMIDPAIPANSAEFAAERKRLVIETVRQLGALGPDILKIQFPIDAEHEPDEAIWLDACQELDEAAPVPWALLSGGDPYDTFKRQVRVACTAGSSGFMVGRAIWREAVTANASQRPNILQDTVLPRFLELAEIAAEHGRGWQAKHVMPSADDSWYRGY